LNQAVRILNKLCVCGKEYSLSIIINVIIIYS
jgi:hypothetical protein